MNSQLSASEARTGYKFIIPVLLALVVTSVLPVIYSIYIAFTNYGAKHFLEFEWVGLANFQRILAGADSQEFLRVLAWTSFFALISVIFGFLVGHILALLLNNPRLRGANVYRTILILPWALPIVITTMCWSVILNSQFGPLNGLLISWGLEPIPWLSDPNWARFAIIVVQIWLIYPFMMTVNLGALQGISQELYEAAEIDGAGSIQKWLYLTLPLLRETLTPLLIAALAAYFNSFNVIFLITGGGPPVPGGQFAGATDNLLTFTFKQMTMARNYGLTAAYGIILFSLIGPITALNFWLSGSFKKKEQN